MFSAEKSIPRTHLTDFMLPVCLFLGCNPDYVAGLDVCLGAFLCEYKHVKKETEGDDKGCCSVAQSCLTLYDLKDCSTPGFPVLYHLPESAQTLLHWLDDDTQTSHLPLPPSPPTLNLFQHQGLFQWVGIMWPKYWSFSFSISLSNKYSALISFRIDWFDLFTVLGTAKGLLQHHSSKAWIL